MPDGRQALHAGNKLAHALDHARYGFNVFPLIPNEKRPLIENWRNLATNDPQQVTRLWSNNPDANIGISTENLLVIDVDPRNGGVGTFKNLFESQHLIGDGFPPTLAAATQGGGTHMLYWLPEGTTVRGGANKLGAGVDVKSHGGYIVGAGSTIDGRAYAWKPSYEPNKRDFAEAPPWLVARCNTAKQKTTEAGKIIVLEDERAVRLCRDWLDESAPHARVGERGFTAYKVACRFYDFGASKETCVELLADWSESHCEAPMDGHDIEHAAHSALKNRENAVGARHPDAPGFDAVEIAPRPAAKEPVNTQKRERFEVIRADEGARRAQANAHLDPLIKGVIDRGVTSVLIGAPGGGKTFLVLDMAYHIAAGKEWAGKRVQQGAVVYLALEAGKLILRRFAAMALRYGSLDGLPLFTIPAPADLAHGTADADALIQVIRKVETDSGHKIELVVIDTLARAISGGDENSSKDMGAVIQASDRIRDAIKTHVMLIHHPGKDESRGGRGSSNVFGAVETEMTVTNKILKFTKQRDMEKGPPIRFSLKPVQIGIDEEGAPITSCFVALAEAGAAGETIDLTKAEQAVFDAILAALNSDDLSLDTPFDVAFVQKASRKTDSVKLPSYQAVNDHLRNLTEKGWLGNPKRGQYVALNGNRRNLTEDDLGV